ncbi:MAG: RluA family pseudouridine synthase [Candidatus Dadabacteria bacterium]|nr:MAG: RluA family pseudouridine synthase [Candidatus Dadabacteria bacterium]
MVAARYCGHPCCPRVTERDDDVRTVELTDSGRLDAVLAGALPDCSRSRLSRWIREGRVQIDGVAATRASQPVRAGMQVRIEWPPPAPPVTGTPVPFTVLYEDDAILVIDKPAGLIVHPGDLNETGTLVHGLLHRYPELANAFGDADPRRPGIVHRLDRGTSGVMVVARTEIARQKLATAFAERQVNKRYFAWVYGTAPESGTWDQPIGRHPRDRKRFAVVAAGKPAVSHFRRRWMRDGVSAIEVAIETGRTHQIRVHAAAARLPLLGDPVYGARAKPPAAFRDWAGSRNRPALHAHRLTFAHPVSGERVTFDAPLPDDLAELDARGC